MWNSLGWSLLLMGSTGLLTVFAGYPALARLAALRTKRGSAAEGDGETNDARGLESVSVIVAMRNAETLLPAKLDSLFALEIAKGRLQVLLASDGSTDGTVAAARRAAAEAPEHVEVQVIELQQHHGKHVALNEAAARANGDVLVFSDVDALLEPDALTWLVRALAQRGVGGVCGRRMIGERDAYLGSAQSSYVALDSGLKGIESRTGSITSNDGKLYAIRSWLFEPIAPGVTDDLFASMSVVRQGGRFVYEGRARAWIRTPSRTSRHEVSRRRRIVCRSLRGIWLQRQVLNPARTGLYGVGLTLNKVGRRLLPFLLLASLLGLALLARESWIARALTAAAALGVTTALMQPYLARLSLPGPLAKALGMAHYFLVGCAGTALGCLDFLLNRRVVRWDPKKAD